MDSNTTVVMLAAFVTQILMSAVLLAAVFRRPFPPLVNINHSGDGSPVTAAVGGSAAPIDNTYTATGSYEDALAYLAQLTDNLEQISAIVEAVHEDRYNEDAMTNIADLFERAGANARLALKTIVGARERQKVARSAAERIARPGTNGAAPARETKGA